MRAHWMIGLWSGFLCLLPVSTVYAHPPLSTSITYQGQLKSAGVPFTGLADVRVELWDDLVGGGREAGPVDFSDVDIDSGLFTITIDFGPGAFDGEARWLEIAVRIPPGSGEYTTLSPRQAVTPAPYALYAAASTPVGAAGGDLSGNYPNPLVVQLQGRAVSSAAPSSGQVLKWTGSTWSPQEDQRETAWQMSGPNISYTIGNVGIGLGDPEYQLHVRSAGSTRALSATHTAVSGQTFGGYFENSSSSGAAVHGRTLGLGGSPCGGLFDATAASGGTGVCGYGGSIGVFGNSSTAGGIGGWFTGSGTVGIGVFAETTAGSSDTYSIRGETLSTTGTGVYGYARSTSGACWGVWGRTDSTASTAHGVVGDEGGGAGHAVFARGTFAATGSKSFQIDHPLRPETHYLAHFCAEGPEPYNIYRGNVITDATGVAEVHLPEYFSQINRDPTYHLTVIDDSDEFVLAKVSRKLQDGRFTIRTSRPDIEVSWEIKAVRDDRWVQRYGYRAEFEKEDEIKGKYLHPELYDRPANQGVLHRETGEADATARPQRPVQQ